MGCISQEKKYAPFKNFNSLEISYVKDARELAQDYKDGKPLDKEKLAKIREEAMNDRKHLKGDFVISLFIQLMEELQKAESNCEYYPCKFYKNMGRGYGKEAIGKEKENQIIEQYINKVPVRKIAEHLEMSPSTVQKYIKQYKKLKTLEKNRAAWFPEVTYFS